MTTRLKNIMQSVCILLILAFLPSTAYLQERKEAPVPPQGAIPQGEAPLPAGATPETAQAPPMEAPPSYTIKKGDTLWDISNTFLKDPFLWPFLWKANTFIANPDLIFPGDKLQIPSLTPIERALQVEAIPGKPVIEKQEPAKKTAVAVEKPVLPREIGQREGIAGAHVTSPTPVQPGPEENADEIRARGLVMPEEQILPIVDKYAMLSAGFVNDENTGDTIVGAPEKGKAHFAYDDIVYVSMRGADTIKIGDKYLIFSLLQKVKHPITGKNFGRLVKGLGILQITAKDPAAKVLTARISLSFDAIEKGNMLTPYQEPTLIFNSSQKKAKDIRGYILEVMDKRTVNAQVDVVYLDAGSVDGVEPGDRFSVYEEPAKRGFPKKLIGEVQVILVKEHTSTAIVTKSTEAMGKGNMVEIKQ